MSDIRPYILYEKPYESQCPGLHMKATNLLWQREAAAPPAHQAGRRQRRQRQRRLGCDELVDVLGAGPGGCKQHKSHLQVRR